VEHVVERRNGPSWLRDDDDYVDDHVVKHVGSMRSYSVHAKRTKRLGISSLTY